MTPVALPLPGGARILAPGSLEVVTTYVLREQLDWFEDEIRWLRGALRPGEAAIDIGANFGVYTLTMARAVGPGGAVWSFEPASEAHGLLARSLALNGFGHVVLERSALSSHEGTGELLLEAMPEANALARQPPAGARTETVALRTLDGCARAYGWDDVAFVKIDAEGEEANIVAGGERFLREASPLVQFEVREGRELHLDLVGRFQALGYEVYRLAPGPALLMPFEEPAPDRYLLNLFACKPETAERLAGRGLLVRRQERRPGTAAASPADAVRAYERSREAARPAAERLHALESALATWRALCEREPTIPRLSSLARAARDHGSRHEAVAALERMIEALEAHDPLGPREPFLPPQALEAGDDIGDEALADRLYAAAVEVYERLHAFSSYYTGAHALGRLELLRAMGHASPEMGRRLALVRERLGLAEAS